MPTRIAQLTDLHLTARAGGRVFGSDVWHNLTRALDCVATHEPPVDRLVLTGDIANAGRSEVYERLVDVLQPWADRLRLLPGNHDHRDRLRSAFPQLWPSPSTHLVFGEELPQCHLLGLDSLCQGRTLGQLGEDQLAWLQTALAAAQKPVVLFLHHPPVRVGCWWLDKDLLRDRQQLERLLAPQPTLAPQPVGAIFTGHVHQEHTLAFAGWPVHTTPAVAYQYRPRSWLPLPCSRQPALRLIEAEAGTISSRVVRL